MDRSLIIVQELHLGAGNASSVFLAPEVPNRMKSEVETPAITSIGSRHPVQKERAQKRPPIHRAAAETAGHSVTQCNPGFRMAGSGRPRARDAGAGCMRLDLLALPVAHVVIAQVSSCLCFPRLGRFFEGQSF